MEQEVMQSVVLEILQELREVKQLQCKTAKALFEMKDEVGGFKQKLANVKLISPAINIQPITAAIDNSFHKVKTTIEAQPKSIIREFRVLLFPECNAAEYYKIVFGRLLFWMMVFLSVTYLFVLSKGFIEGYISVRQREVETFQYRKAWNYLYHNSKKAVRQKMDSAWSKTAYR